MKTARKRRKKPYRFDDPHWQPKYWRALAEAFNFTACQEFLDNGSDLWGPRVRGKRFNGSMQINVYGSKRRYAALGKFFTQLSEHLGKEDHEHYELVSADKLARLHFIFRTGVEA